MPSTVDLTPVFDFLPCRTPDAWLSAAVKSLPVLMIDHANCEKKAAATKKKEQQAEKKEKKKKKEENRKANVLINLAFLESFNSL